MMSENNLYPLQQTQLKIVVFKCDDGTEDYFKY